MKKIIVVLAGLVFLSACSADPVRVTETPAPVTATVEATVTPEPEVVEVVTTFTPEPKVVTKKQKLPAWYEEVKKCLDRDGDIVSAQAMRNDYDDAVGVEVNCSEINF